ncbi:MAG: UDP-3-O-acyl-N-acetylglucosamine deacetylase [Deltaproteobacteria bacterium]|nr:UDP-3-O-acyl-N-acetylglucosamine deacetylase [Deltaproteobacteria bacterium]
MPPYQHTITQEVRCSGIGLHSGLEVNLIIKPAPANTGIIFKRTDLPGKPSVPAHYKYITDTTLATTLGVGDASVATVEHLMAAFMGMGIDNALVEIDGSEVPSLDGSAAPFVLMLNKARPVKQREKRAYIRIIEPIQVRCEDKTLSIYPDNSLKITYSIDFNHPLIQQQSYSMTFSEETFCQEIANARTFGFLYEVQNLKENGFALGGSLDNAIVMDDSSILNEGGLRFENEFVRHKILDLLGDIALLGKPILGHIVVHKSGHTLHHRLLQKIGIQTGRWVECAGLLGQHNPQTGVGYVNVVAPTAPF